MSFEPYQSIESWSRKKLEAELEAIYRDKQSGLMGEQMYRECYDILLGELIKREDKDDVDEAYKRAMAGI